MTINDLLDSVLPKKFPAHPYNPEDEKKRIKNVTIDLCKQSLLESGKIGRRLSVEEIKKAIIDCCGIKEQGKSFEEDAKIWEDSCKSLDELAQAIYDTQGGER